ncbi:MAG: N-acyl-D-glutamate deacylase [Eubacterium sp.]|nr:N-acyl-D-glutamate deacylase [Eubacterium sp.]
MLDIAINKGTLIDPEHNSCFSGSLGIKDGKLSEITKQELVAEKIIDAAGLIVCPGFIDVHGHIDGDPYCGELSLRQGVTTTIGGNCGLSPVDMHAFLESQDKNGFIINQAELVGHSFSLRKAAGITDVYAPACIGEISKMQYLTEKALEEGACGLSFGLDYAPNSSWEEILTLSKIAAKYKRPIAIHTRVFSENDPDSLREVFNIARTTGAEVLISHFVYQYNTMMAEALELTDIAVEEGLKIRIDSGMYTDWATSIGTATFSEENIERGFLSLNRMLVASGKYKGQILNLELYKELRRTSPHECIIYFTGTDENIYPALKKGYAMPSSDTGAYLRGEGHPQIAGTFPRYFRYMVRERNEISLVEAIRKATFYPAETMGLKHKGRLSPGADADLVVFDSNTIQDKACFPDKGLPDKSPEGIKYVFVNGILALNNGVIQCASAGKTIRM